MSQVLNKLLPTAQRLWDSAVPFQIEDAEFAIKNRRLVLGHKTGLGKTFISLMAWSRWLKVRKVLIVGTLSSTGVWRRILRDWCGAESTFIQGYNDPNWQKAKKSATGIYLTTYASLRGLMEHTIGKVEFDLVDCDEIHRVLRSRNTAVYKNAMLRLDFEYFLGLSATWSSRGAQDLWPVLHLINKKLFPSFWTFAETWCFVEKSTFGTEIFGVRNAGNLRKLLWSKYYVARTWKQVGSQFTNKPVGEEPVVRRLVYVPMSDEQKTVYSELQEDMIATIKEATVVTPTVLARQTRLLQTAICPRVIFPEAEIGPAIDYVVDQISDDPHAVVFTPFAQVFPYVREALENDGYTNGIFELKGGMHPDKIDAIIAAWKKAKGVMLCTITFAQSFSLDTTDNAYMLGFDWDPNNNIQAEGRLRRFDSILQSPCMVHYIVVTGSDYEKVADVVNGKIYNVREFLMGYGGVLDNQIPLEAT